MFHPSYHRFYFNNANFNINNSIIDVNMVVIGLNNAVINVNIVVIGLNNAIIDVNRGVKTICWEIKKGE